MYTSNTFSDAEQTTQTKPGTMEHSSSAKRERKPVTIRLDTEVVDYFKAEADRTGIPYQNLINLYLLQCAQEGKTVTVA